MKKKLRVFHIYCVCKSCIWEKYTMLFLFLSKLYSVNVFDLYYLRSNYHSVDGVIDTPVSALNVRVSLGLCVHKEVSHLHIYMGSHAFQPSC